MVEGFLRWQIWVVFFPFLVSRNTRWNKADLEPRPCAASVPAEQRTKSAFRFFWTESGFCAFVLPKPIWECVVVFYTEIGYVRTWSCPCKWEEGASTKGGLCKRRDWFPHPAFSPWREANTWNEEWEIRVVLSRGLSKFLRGCDGIWNAFSLAQASGQMFLCLQSQESPHRPGFDILLCLETRAGLLLLLEHLLPIMSILLEVRDALQELDSTILVGPFQRRLFCETLWFPMVACITYLLCN